MSDRKRFFATILSLFGIISSLSAREIPPLSAPVVDEAHVVDARMEASLNDYLHDVERATGIQIAVLTVSSLEGEALEEFSIRVADEWQLGQKGEDNGVLLLAAMEERKLRIEVGYGLEGRLTDATSGMIIREYLQPYFRQGDYSNGIAAASQAIVHVAAAGQEIPQTAPQPSTPVPTTRRSRSRGLPINFFFFMVIFLLGGVGRGRRGGGLFRALFWSSILRDGTRHRRGPFDGGFGGGGFGGGGFSGGGGSFGGGGASGGW